MSCRSGSESGQQAPGFGHRCGGRLAKALRPALAALATVTSLAVAPAPAVAWTQQAFLLSDVVVRSQRGDSPASILNALRVSRTSFALRGSDFARLRAAGVSDAVLDLPERKALCARASGINSRTGIATRDSLECR